LPAQRASFVIHHAPAMNRLIDVTHETRYDYAQAVERARHLAHLTPWQDAHQRVLQHAITIDPPPSERHGHDDVFGNAVAGFMLAAPHRHLLVRHQARVLVTSRAAVLNSLPWEEVAARLAFHRGHGQPEAAQFAADSPYVRVATAPAWRDTLQAWARPGFAPGVPVHEGALGLMHHLNQTLRYRSGSTEVDTPLADVLRTGEGVCQDFAHLMIAALRSLGLAARYVSGYVLSGERTHGAEASHAWVEVWCPSGDGAQADAWQAFDPTNAVQPCTDVGAGALPEHLGLARGRDYGDVAPVRGIIRGGGVHQLTVTVRTQASKNAAATPELAPQLHPRDGASSMSSLMFDEMQASATQTRPHYQRFAQWQAEQSLESMCARREEAELIFRRVGITFAVYGEKDDTGAGTERLIPFDLIPRIIPAGEWAILQRGLVQRVTALNRFVHDVYHGQEILKAGVVPAEQVLHNAQYRREMAGVDVPGGIYSHIAGIDIVRAAQPDGSGAYYVLEDNLRVPSGVSYMLENRKMMMRLFPELFAQHRIAPVAHYPDLLLETLRSLAPAQADEPTVVLLTPGQYNSAYFEHAFLAQQMGIELVQGPDLTVRDGFVFMRTTQGFKRVDVIYRRVDDDFLDPKVFRPDSTLGCAGLLDVYRSGHVTLANAIGTGVADDKSIYPYVPKMIEFYLGEQPILHNVPTYQCRVAEDLRYVLDHLSELVVKEVHGAGGYGMLVGPAASKAEIENFRRVLIAHPANYIAQPTLALSTCPTYVEAGIAPRHIDLRPFVLSGKQVQMAPGGLTRVALKEGSLVVNSSQGGGTKDTWVLED
jgi:uncharacterized circularly permuted ATP-grasp superfamily protein/transglutaminase-like putative cysteine protease